MKARGALSLFAALYRTSIPLSELSEKLVCRPSQLSWADEAH